MKKEFIIEENNKMVKYLVEYEYETLERLRKEICKKCGIRRHIKTKQSYTSSDATEEFLIENYTFKKIGEKDYDYGCYDLYEVNYDLIKEPKLALLIKDFLYSNKNDIINLVLYDKYDLEENSLDLSIGGLKQRAIEELNSENISSLKTTLNNLENFINDKNMNEKLELENQKEYILKVKSLIRIKKIDELNLEIYNKTKEFIQNAKVLELK